jgi:hypothetical protein
MRTPDAQLAPTRRADTSELREDTEFRNAAIAPSSPAATAIAQSNERPETRSRPFGQDGYEHTRSPSHLSPASPEIISSSATRLIGGNGVLSSLAWPTRQILAPCKFVCTSSSFNILICSLNDQVITLNEPTASTLTTTDAARLTEASLARQRTEDYQAPYDITTMPTGGVLSQEGHRIGDEQGYHSRPHGYCLIFLPLICSSISRPNTPHRRRFKYIG